MTENVVQLRPALVGDDYRISVDNVLENSKGRLACVVVVGQTTEGEQFVAGSEGAPETVFQLELAKLWLLQNQVERQL